MYANLVAGGVNRAEFAVLVVKNAGNRTAGAFEVGLDAVEIVGPEEELPGPGSMLRLLLVEQMARSVEPKQMMCSSSAQTGSRPNSAR